MTIFGADMSLSVHVVNRIKDILTLGKDLAQVLDDTSLTAKTECAKNFREKEKKICLSLHYNGGVSNLFNNGVEI